MNTSLYFLTTLSSLHIGTGQGMDDIDLPVSRDAVTGHPDAPGSALKGVWRDHALASAADSSESGALVHGAFGREDETGPDYAAAVSFGDGRLVLLPVKSYHGTFAWVASPISLRGLRRLQERCGKVSVPSVPVSLPAAAVAHGSAVAKNSRLALHEFDLPLASEPAHVEAAQSWAGWLAPLLFALPEDQSAFVSRFAILPDEVFDFLCESALPVMARNCVGPLGIVKTGALWYEESVPAEALFAGVLTAVDGLGEYRALKAGDFLRHLTARPVTLQVGGKATTGRGFVRLSFPSAAEGGVA